MPEIISGTLDLWLQHGSSFAIGNFSRRAREPGYEANKLKLQMDEDLPLLSRSPSATDESQTITKPSKTLLRRYVTVAVILVSCFMNYVCIYIPSPFYPQIAAKRKGSKADTEVGVMVGSMQLSAAFVSLYIGRYLNRLGVRFLVTSGVFLVGGCTVIFGFLEYVKEWSPFIGLSIVIRFVMGFGEAAFDATSIALLLGMFPSHTATIWGLYEFAVTLGLVSGAPLGGFLYHAEGFYFPFVIIGGVLLLCTPLLWLLLSDCHSLIESTDDDQTDCDQSVSLLQLLKIPSIVLVLLNVSTCYAALALCQTSAAMFLYKEFGWGTTHIGLIFLNAGAVYLVFTVVFGLVVDATNPRIVMIIGLLVDTCAMMIFGPSFVFSFLSPKPWCVYVGATLWGFGVAMVVISSGPDVILTAISRGYEKNMALNGAVSGLVLAAIFLSGTLGAAIGGGLTAAMNFRISSSVFGFASFLLMIVTTVVTVVNAIMSRRQ
ncbi:MFS-type transporter SLC18B1-like [Corticium candelabrum]|uniref:MFS-type transporter SLC18B1-like n=1 Tax=Corticium candelabrum TaxID=121492 RepID=UPI002E25EAC8|nr:MFS-type transporter SLC18B1-like [Corticium candelabrum]